MSSGIFQGDSLSQHFYFLALIPHAKFFDDAHNGYNIIDKNINHPFCIGDLKLFAKGDERLQSLLGIAKQFTGGNWVSMNMQKLHL